MRIFSGIQPTGQKTFGNYAGGFSQYATTQDAGEAFFCIVDLHSITVPHDPVELRTATLDLAAMLFATGLDPERSTIFVQSHNRAHAQAAWLLSSVATYGEMRRMTQFKDKAARHEFVSAGLFTYPVLMAADILLYQTDLVPVGEDQRQHVELTRDVAIRFNQRFGPILTVPQPVFPSAGARIMDLQEPERKMSTTTSGEMGRILLVDPPEVVRKKIRGAMTDAGREVRRGQGKGGIANLIEIMSVASGEAPDTIEERFHNSGYGAFKAAVAEAVIELLTPIQDRYQRIRDDQGELEGLLRKGALKAREASHATLDAMYRAMGFIPAGLD